MLLCNVFMIRRPISETLVSGPFSRERTLEPSTRQAREFGLERLSIPTNEQFSYRPEIDGLRALAVTAVILNHAHHQWLPSGYLGVDIFFVISGFVITQSLCAQEHDSFGSFFASFIARRMRRLAPALILCIFVSSIAVWLLVPTPKSSLATGLSALFGASNLFLYFEHVDYFSPARDLNVFLHTWSLGLEEQFYLLFPVIFWFSGLGKREASRFRIIMVTLCVLSFAASLTISRIDPTASFFLTPFRLWELGAGALLFEIWRSADRQHQLGFERLVAVVVLGFLVVILLLPAPQLELWQASAVVLTMILIRTARMSSGVFSVLTQPFVVFVGRISYPLYLWHWTIFSLSRWANLDLAPIIPIQLSLILLLSFLTFRYVETPLRCASSLRRSCIAIGAFSILSVVCSAVVLQLINARSMFGIASAAHNSSKESFPPPFLPLKQSGLNFDPNCVVDGDKRLLTERMFDLCTVPPKRAGAGMIWAVGDSHAGHLQALLYSVHDKTGMGVHLIETPGFPFPMRRNQFFQPRQQIFNDIVNRMSAGDVVLIGRLFLNRENVGVVDDLHVWSADLLELGRQLALRNVSVVIVGPPPMFNFNSLYSCLLMQGTWFSCDVDRRSVANRVDGAESILKAAADKAENIFLFDTFSVLCPISRQMCSPFADGMSMFRDRDHLNSAGADKLVEAFLAFLRERQLVRVTE